MIRLRLRRVYGWLFLSNTVLIGVIILLHDGYLLSRKQDVAATKLIIAGLEARGYRFVTVPELLSLGRRHPIFHRSSPGVRLGN